MTAGRTNTYQYSRSWCTQPKHVEEINSFFDNNIMLDPCYNIYSLINSQVKYMLHETY